MRSKASFGSNILSRRSGSSSHLHSGWSERHSTKTWSVLLRSNEETEVIICPVAPRPSSDSSGAVNRRKSCGIGRGENLHLGCPLQRRRSRGSAITTSPSQSPPSPCPRQLPVPRRRLHRREFLPQPGRRWQRWCRYHSWSVFLFTADAAGGQQP